MDTPSTTPSISLKEMTKSLATLAQLESDIFSTPIDQEYLENVKLWGAGLFRLVVMGEIKQGKSSFINALLGVKNLVPVNSNVATSTIFKIRYGQEKRYRVFFTRDSQRPEQIINESELDAYGTEDGNPDNCRQVDFIEVCVPAPLLKSGIVIVDTPGLGGLFKKHKEITYKYAPKADAIFFVTDSIGSPLGLQEISFLKELKSITHNIYFVQSKSNAADTPTRQAREKNNKDILMWQVGFKQEEINYFTVDSNLKLEADEAEDQDDLQDSGFPPLMLFLQNHLLKNQRKLIAERAMINSLPKIERIRGELSSKNQLLSADTESQQKQLSDQFQSAQADFKRWNNEEKPKLISEIQKEISAIRLDAIDQIRSCQPGGEIQQEFENLINQAEDAGQLKAILAQISDRIPEYISKVTMNTERTIQEKAEEALSRISLRGKYELSTEVNHREISSLNTTALQRQLQQLQEGSSLFDDARTAIYGGMAGATIGAIIGSVIPVVGTIIGSGLGMFIAGAFGSGAAITNKREQELRSFKQQASNGISQTLSSAYTQMQSSIERNLQNIQHAVSNAIQSWVADTQSDYERQMAELTERKNMSAEQLKEKRQQLLGWQACLQQIERGLPHA